MGLGGQALHPCRQIPPSIWPPLGRDSSIPINPGCESTRWSVVGIGGIRWARPTPVRFRFRCRFNRSPRLSAERSPPEPTGTKRSRPGPAGAVAEPSGPTGRNRAPPHPERDHGCRWGTTRINTFSIGPPMTEGGRSWSTKNNDGCWFPRWRNISAQVVARCSMQPLGGVWNPCGSVHRPSASACP